MRRLIVTAIALGSVACATAPAPPPALVDPKTPLERLADSTSFLVTMAAIVSDSAILQASFATIDGPADRQRGYVTTARDAAQRVTRSLDDAIEKGNRLQAKVEPEGSVAAGSRRYSHYWHLGRAKLDVARVESERAATAADSALACTLPSCTVVSAQALRTHSQLAAGAVREAESLVRIALLYLKK
jgi:hypothetical protein